LLTFKTFARKVIETNTWVPNEMSTPATNGGQTYPANEIRIITLLNTKAGHKNIVPVLKHGWLEKNGRYYFFDMERCPLTLEAFLRLSFRPVIGLDRYLSLEGRAGDLGVFNMWSIVRDVAAGVVFIHELGEVHRDLKPNNG
jgi:serine/threonine protein kinase